MKSCNTSRSQIIVTKFSEEMITVNITSEQIILNMSLYTIAILIFILLLWLKKKHQFWKNRGVAYEKPTPIVGNYGKVILMKQSEHVRLKEIYEQFPNEKAVGLYQGYKPCILLKDPDMIKQVFIKDFSLFQDRDLYIDDGTFKDNLVIAQGKKWRMLRKKLRPIFSSGKLKSMMPLINKGAEDFLKYVDNLLDSNTENDVRALTAKYTLEVMGSCMFGIEMDAFANKENVFSKMTADVLPETLQVSILQSLKGVIPGFMKFFNTKIYKPKPHVRLEQFFGNFVEKFLQEREGKPKLRYDLMDYLIELKEQSEITVGDKHIDYELLVDKELIAAQVFTFYTGGYETSSSAMAYMLHALAYNEVIQYKAHNEIVAVTKKYNGLITYEGIDEMIYLNMVFNEAVRMHPVAGTIVRKSSVDYTFPNEKLTIPKGCTVFVNLIGLHRDSKYYPNPEKFDPERFSPENKQKLPTCAYLPFGEGPRNCIGFRFAKIQTLGGIAAFLKRFKVEPSTRTEENVKYNSFTVLLLPKSGIWLKISRR